ncbi:hypothetical protein ABER02_19275 [Rossellomorea marisflavi]|uniref:hypothetical protein n=1 Tax=Rossellomorea marisflavi TaxID=189381 RepID=UPI003D29C279
MFDESKKDNIENLCIQKVAPKGCPDIFPADCINPMIQLDQVVAISCSGTLTGRVLCDMRPLPLQIVNLSSSFPGLTFGDATPVTNRFGQFSTTVTIPRGTLITPNVTITASTEINGRTDTTSITTRVGCVICQNPELTINTLTGVVDCQGAQVSGRLTCDGQSIPDAAISFTVQSASGRVVVNPNPSITGINGEYSAILLPFTGVDETITLTASTTIGGITVSTPPQSIRVICPPCDSPSIQLDETMQISCDGILSGRLTCNGTPIPNVPVTFSSDPILNFTTPISLTNQNGEFSSAVTVDAGTPNQTASYTASASPFGIPVSASSTVIAGCEDCVSPLLTLNVPAQTVGCEGAQVTGQLTCDGRPIAGAPITFTIIPAAADVIISPNPAITEADGTYVASILPGLGASELITIQATTTVGGIPTSSPTRNVLVNCECVNPIIQLDNPSPISCSKPVTGRVLCEGIPVPNVEVTLSSTVVNFSPSQVITNENGEFQSLATVPPLTPVQEGVPITASAEVNNIPIATTTYIRASCLECPNPALSLNPPGIVVGCEGAYINGTLLCDGSPVSGIPVFFTVTSPGNNVFVMPNPAITQADGSYTATVQPAIGAVESVTISASATVGGQDVTAGPINVSVDCPLPPEDCPCRFRLNTQGGAQPGAQIRVTQFGNAMDYTGTLNITVVQCGEGIQGICNPAVDNFNFVFNAGSGENFQFTQGRRTTITCEGDLTIATVQGLINGRINNGPSRTFEAQVTATLNTVTDQITWEIFATDNSTTTFQTLVPFVSQGSPTSFITDCNLP